MTSAVAAARVALTPFEPSDAAVVSWQQLGSRTEANGGRVAHLQADADKFVELCKTAGPLLETICAELGDRAEEIDELGDHADRHDQSALVSSLEALVGAFSAADGGSEAARTREFTKYASDIKEQRARRMTAAAAVVITNRPAADDAEIIAALGSPDSDLATLPAKSNGQDVHLDTSAVSELASSVARDAAKVFRAHNLGADRAAVVRDAYQKLNAVWKQSRNGPLLPIHDTAPAASRLEAQKRNAADQHAHQVRWVVEIQKVECRDPQPFFATIQAPCRSRRHCPSPLTRHPPPPPHVCAQMKHAELLAIVGALEKHGIDTLARAAKVAQPGPWATMIQAVHIVVVVSRPSCSSCKTAMKHLAKILKLRITVAQGNAKGPPFVTTFHHAV